MESNNYYPTYTKDLEDSIQTLELMNTGVFCQCANWATVSENHKSKDTGNIIARSVFIEPANDSLTLSDTLGYSGDLLRFTGRFYKDKGYPKHFPITEMTVEKARVFRYNSYEVLRSNYRDFIKDTIDKGL